MVYNFVCLSARLIKQCSWLTYWRTPFQCCSPLLQWFNAVLLCPNSITSILLKTCLKPGLRHVLSRKKVGDLVSDKKKSQTCRCPNSIRSILLKTCLKPGFRQVLSRKKVGDLVSDKIDLSRHVEIDLATSFRQIKKSETWTSPTCLRPGLRQDRSNGIWALHDSVCRPLTVRSKYSTFFYLSYELLNYLRYIFVLTIGFSRPYSDGRLRVTYIHFRSVCDVNRVYFWCYHTCMWQGA